MMGDRLSDGPMPKERQISGGKSAREDSQRCQFCDGGPQFNIPYPFLEHLRMVHCTREGGSYVCRYGANSVCQSLPFDGVSDRDYEEHIRKDHLSKQVRSFDGSRSDSSSPAPSVVRDSFSDRFTVFSSTQNLSSVLSDPGKTRRETAAFFTRDHGEYFVEKTHVTPSPYLQRISKGHFQDYLAAVGKKQKRHVKDEKALLESEKRRTLVWKAQHDSPSFSVERRKPNLEQIPKIFLSTQFSLEETRTFEKVFLEPLELLDSPSSPPDLVDSHPSPSRQKLRPNKLLQEKLTHYLDIVESQIGQQIAGRSTTFFKAMTSHDQLQTYLAQTKYAVQKLRHRIADLDASLVERSCRLLSLHRARINHSNLMEKLHLIATVKETQPTVQVLLQSLDFLGALDVIATTQDVLAEELQGILSFRHLSLQLMELQNVISKILQEEFVHYIQSEMTKPLTDESQLTIDEQQLSSLVLGLLRVSELRFVQVLKQEMETAAKNLIREKVREKLSGLEMGERAESPEVLKAKDQLLNLNFAQWIDLLAALLDTVLLFCKKIQMIQDVLVDLVDIAGGRCVPPATPCSKVPEATHLHTPVQTEVEVRLPDGDYYQLREAVVEISYHVCCFVDERIRNVFNAKNRDNFLERLSGEDFVRLSSLVEAFSGRCESVTGGRKVSILRNFVATQATKLAARFHQDKKTKLGNILDSEHWRQADVPGLFQELVEAWERTGKLRDVSNTDRPSSLCLCVGGRQYAVVGTALLLVQMVSQYCGLLELLPALAPDLLSRLVELLKSFNSRTCQLILGAGALQLVGLKTISAKNLALALRCLELVTIFVVAAQKEFESTLPPNQANLTRHFNQVLKDYQDHIDELFNKLVAVMDHHMYNCLKKWEVKPPAPSPCFKQIEKHVRRFYESIKDILPPDQIQKLFLRIHDGFKRHFRNSLLELELWPGGSRYDFVCSEFSFYMETIKGVPPCAALADSMNDVFAHK